MAKIIRSLYTFYLNHFFVGVCITVSCVWLYNALGSAAISYIFWFKIATMAIFWYAVSQRKSREFIYFQNLGISKRLLWTVTLGIDLLIFLVAMSLAIMK